MTKQEASERYNIPIWLLDEYESWGLCQEVKKVMGSWQYDDSDLERLSMIMTLHDVGFTGSEIETYTTTMNDRLEKGVEAQTAIFGEHMKEAWKKGHINRWLAANCFGDFYTRTGLDLPQREMITFCFLMAQGGCEPQLIAHAKGNMNLGNDKDFLVRVVSQCLPYIGYPRSLNAVSVLDKC